MKFECVIDGLAPFFGEDNIDDAPVIGIALSLDPTLLLGSIHGGRHRSAGKAHRLTDRIDRLWPLGPNVLKNGEVGGVGKAQFPDASIIVGFHCFARLVKDEKEMFAFDVLSGGHAAIVDLNTLKSR